MAFQISLNSKSSIIHHQYHDGISLGNVPFEVGLKSFVTYNSVPNITDQNNKFVVIGDNKAARIVTIPTGTYELKDLIATMQRMAPEAELMMELNKIRLKVFIQSRLDLDFTCRDSIAGIFGFSKQILEKGELYHSDLNVDIFPINTIRVHCNLINCNIENGHRHDNTLYEFPLNTLIGERIVERPNNILYYRVIPSVIYDLFIQIVDQNNNPVNFQGEQISITLDFRPV